MTDETLIFTCIGMFICFLVYIVPTIIAFVRGHKHRWIILLLNLGLGLTVIVWFALILWASGKFDDTFG